MIQNSDLEKIDELEQIYNHAPIGLCVFDLNLCYKRINHMLADMGGFSIDEHIGQSVFKIIPKLGNLVEQVTQKVIHTKKPVLDVNVTGPTARYPDVMRTYKWSCYPLFDADQNIASYTFIVEDVTDAIRAHHNLIDSEKRFREMADKAPVMIWISNSNKQYLYLSRGWYNYLGGELDIQKNDDLAFYINPDDYAHWINVFNSANKLQKSFNVECRLRKYDGNYRWFTSQGVPQFGESGEFEGFIGSAIDIHDLKTAEVQLRDYKVRIDALNRSLKEQVDIRTVELKRLALYNIYTNMPNRNSLDKDVGELISSLKKVDAANFAILIIDLINFNEITDFFGRAMADNLLFEFANKLKFTISDCGDVYHLDGNRFAVALKRSGSHVEVRSIIHQIIRDIDQGWLIDENIIYSDLNIGACIFNHKYESADAMIAHADMALSIAKKDGVNSVIFEPEMEGSLRNRILITKDLRKAIEFNQFFLLFQPQINSENGQISGIEALIRWNHPSEGIKKPYEFIPYAEDSGIIIEIGNWVVRECCAQLSNWARSGIDAPPISMNISPYQLKNQSQFIDVLQNSIVQFRIPSSKIEIEITENALLDLPDNENNTLHKIRQMGMRISLDDFGTGYASLDYLSKFPVDRIKIAQNFVSDVIQSPRNRAIIEATIFLAQKLSVDVIVEGVETREQLQLLSSLGCKEFQGFYFSEPMSARMMTEMLAAHSA